MNALLGRLAGFAARRHWIVIAAWLIVLVGLLAAKSLFGGHYVNDYSVSGSDSAAGLDVLKSTFPKQSGYSGQIVFHAPKGIDSAQQSAINQSIENVAKLPDVVQAVSPFAAPGSGPVSKDGETAYANVGWSVNPDSLDTGYLDKLNAAVAPARSAGLQVEYGAGAGQIGQQTSDLKSEVIGLTCALVLLLIMFGSLMAAAIPLVSALSVLCGLSLVAVLARVVTFPTTAPTIATLLGLGVAVDYGLFMVARHREQLDGGAGVVASIRRAAQTSGAAIVVAGSTVAISVLGLYISGVGFVGALGLASAVVVVVTMISALTFVPALMGLVKEGVRSLKARARAHKEGLTAQQEATATSGATRRHLEHSAFARWGRMVSGHPWPWAAASVAVLLVLAIPLLSITLGQPDNGTNPTSESSRRAFDLMSQGFGVGTNGPLTVVVELPANQSSAETSSLLSSMQADISKTAGVAAVTAPTVNSSGTTAVFNVIPTTRPQATQTTALIDTLREDVLSKQPVTTYVTGGTAGAVDFTHKITSRLVWLILAVIALSFVLLTVAFRSVVIATKAAILNLLSIGAAYGVIVAIFEWGWGKSLIGLQSTLPIPAYVPMLVFCIVFGLSMDYEVFLLSRVREAWIDTLDAQRSVAIGISATARVITTAAAIMVVVFTSFVIDPDPTIKMLALGMAFAVLIDATVVRMCLVPSIMSVLGSRAWWMPRWLERVVPKVRLEEGVPEPEPVA